MFNDRFGSPGLSFACRRRAGCLLLWGVLASGSACLCSSSPAPAGGEIFRPAPNHHFNAPTGEVEIVGLSGHVVCYTTDGTDPVQANGACSGASTARLSETSRITLSCGKNETSATSVHGVKLAFDWDGLEGLTAEGNYVLDCTSATPERDGDGVPDDRDNCPVTRNPDQVDSDHDGIGDACENSGEPDAECDGRPDATDNCPTVWNVDQGDDDRDGIGNVCDPTPRGDADPSVPWDNAVLARAFAKWREDAKCSMNGCKNPSAPGTWSASCEGGGTVTWEVALNGFRANSTFTYKSCRHTVSVDVHDYARDPKSTDAGATVPMDIIIIADGSFVADTDFGSNGTESGTVTIGGSFTGRIADHGVFTNGVIVAGTYVAVSCTADPIPQEDCAPNNLSVNYVHPDWSCEPGGCPTPSAPLVDSDGDGVFDRYDNCPTVVNPTQANADFDSLGDACDPDPVPGGGPSCSSHPSDAGFPSDAESPTDAGSSPAFWALKVKVGRCLYDDADGGIGSTGSCDPAQSNQKWDVLDAGSGARAFRNRDTTRCLTAASWFGNFAMAPCNLADASGQWLAERNEQGGFDPMFPMRLKSVAQGYCLYADGTGPVYATQWNCDLLGSTDNLKVGLYPGGNLSGIPVQP